MPTNDGPFSGGFDDPLTLLFLGLGTGILGNNRRGAAPGQAIAGGLQGAMQGLMLGRNAQDQRETRDLTREKLRFEIDEAKAQRAGMAEFLESIKPYMGGGGGAPSSATAVPGGYTAITGQAESGGRYDIPNARGSGAWGKYQFMPDTWADVASKNPDLQLPFNMRQSTPEQQEAAMAALTRMNGGALQQSGLPVTPVTLYAAHRFGPNGAKTVLSADPNTPISTLFPPVWTEQNPDLKGATVGQWLQGASQRFAGAGVPQGDSPPADGSGTPLPPRQAPAQQPQRQPLNIPLELILRGRANKATAPIAETLLTIQNQDRTQANTDRGHGLEVDKFGYTKQKDTQDRADAERRWKAEQERIAAKEEFERTHSGEFVRGPDGSEVFVPKAQLGPEVRRYDKPPEPGTDTGDYRMLTTSDPTSREYKAAYNRIKGKLIDIGGGQKLPPDMSAFAAPSFEEPAAAPAAQPIGGKAYTEAQSKDHTYAARLNNAIPQLEEMIKGPDGRYSTARLPASSERVKMDSPYYPDSLLSDNTKAFRRVTKDIVTALLRRESGANVPQSEYPPEFAKFIPQPGDSHDELASKLKGLKIAASSIAEATGRDRSAYPNLFGGGEQSQNGSAGAPYTPPAGVPIYDINGRRLR